MGATGSGAMVYVQSTLSTARLEVEDLSTWDQLT